MTVRWIQPQTTVRGFRWLGQSPACAALANALANAKQHQQAAASYLVTIDTSIMNAQATGDDALAANLQAQRNDAFLALKTAEANTNTIQQQYNDCESNQPPPGGNAPPPAGCSDANPCPPDQECVNGQCLPLCGPGTSRNPMSGECETNQPTATKAGTSALGVVLLVGAVLGAIYFGVLAPTAGRTVRAA